MARSSYSSVTSTIPPDAQERVNLSILGAFILAGIVSWWVLRWAEKSGLKSKKPMMKIERQFWALLIGLPLLFAYVMVLAYLGILPGIR